MKLNPQNYFIRQPAVLTCEGLNPDSWKVAAVYVMPTPKKKDDVKRFLGFFIYIAKFIPSLSELDAPLRELLKIDASFYWQPANEEPSLN